MEGESGVTRSISDELHSWDFQRDQMEGKTGLSRSIIDENHSSDIRGDQMEGEIGVPRRIIDEIHSSDIQRDQMEGESVLLEISLKIFILRLSKEIKWKVKVESLEVSLMN